MEIIFDINFFKGGNNTFMKDIYNFLVGLWIFVLLFFVFCDYFYYY